MLHVSFWFRFTSKKIIADGVYFLHCSRVEECGTKNCTNRRSDLNDKFALKYEIQITCTERIKWKQVSFILRTVIPNSIESNFWIDASKGFQNVILQMAFLAKWRKMNLMYTKCSRFTTISSRRSPPIKMTHKFGSQGHARPKIPPPLLRLWSFATNSPPTGASGCRSDFQWGMLESRIPLSQAEKNSPLSHRIRGNCLMQCVGKRDVIYQNNSHTALIPLFPFLISSDSSEATTTRFASNDVEGVARNGIESGDCSSLGIPSLYNTACLNSKLVFTWVERHGPTQGINFDCRSGNAGVNEDTKEHSELWCNVSSCHLRKLGTPPTYSVSYILYARWCWPSIREKDAKFDYEHWCGTKKYDD